MNDFIVLDRDVKAAFQWRARQGQPEGLLEQILQRSTNEVQRPRGRAVALRDLAGRRQWIALLAAALAAVIVGAALLAGAQRVQQAPLVESKPSEPRSPRSVLSVALNGDETTFIDAVTGAPVEIDAIRHLNLAGQPTISPDASTVAFWTNDSALAVARIHDGTVRNLAGPVSHHGLGGSSLSWSWDSTTISYPDLDTLTEGLNLVSADGRGLPHRVPVDFAAANAAFAPSGDAIAFGCGPIIFGETGLHLCVATGDGLTVRRLPTLLAHSRPAVVDLSWAPDNRRLVALLDTGLTVIDTQTGKETPLGLDDRFPAWSPDGSTIVAIHDDGTSARLDAVDPDGTGSRILADGLDLHSAVERDTMPYGPTWSPDGRTIAVVTRDHRLVLVEGADGSTRTLVQSVSMLFGWQIADVG